MVLFINAAFRDDSRTHELAGHYLTRYSEKINTVELGDRHCAPLYRDSLAKYSKAVSESDFSDPMFDAAKEFASANEIIIAAPFWNYSIPAALHDYLELVCTQGITFDMDKDGNYIGLCHAKKLVFITTAGGYIPKEDHAFSYIETLSKVFWHIDDLEYYKADGIDIVGNDVHKILQTAKDSMN